MKKRMPRFDMEELIGYVLLIGVIISAGFISAGILWTLALTWHAELHVPLSDINIWHFWLATARAYRKAALALPALLVSGGIGALLLTPYLRVLASLLYFAFVERNWKFVVFTAIVLAILTHSLFLR